MKLIIGKRYELRCGLITGTLEKSNNGTNYKFSAKVVEPEYPTPSIRSWKENGRFLIETIDHKLDIIKEHEDEN